MSPEELPESISQRCSSERSCASHGAHSFHLNLAGVGWVGGKSVSAVSFLTDGGAGAVQVLVAMRAGSVWGAAEPLLLSVSSGGAESSQAPWEIPGEAPGLRVSKKLTHLEALGKESWVSPGRPWLGILLVTQLCGMGSAAPVSRDSLQQNPGDDRLRGSC